MTRMQTEPTSTKRPSSRVDGSQVVIFANPFSGSGPNRRHVARFAAALRGCDLEPTVLWERDDQRRWMTDAQRMAQCRCVVAAGGDGSVAGVINAMAAAGVLDSVAFATLPIGTENLFAREFGFSRKPRQLQRIARGVAEGRTRPIDLGQAGDRLFTLMASAGFDADIVHRMNRWRNGCGDGVLRRVNRFSYAPRIFDCLREYAWPPVTLEVDGERHTGSHVFVFNLPQYGGNLGIGRHACCDDAKLDWVVFERPGLASLGTYAWNVIRGRHLEHPGVRHGCATRVRIESQVTAAVQADGDPAGFTPVEVTIRACALRVIDLGADGAG